MESAYFFYIEEDVDSMYSRGSYVGKFADQGAAKDLKNGEKFTLVDDNTGVHLTGVNLGKFKYSDEKNLKYQINMAIAEMGL